MKKLLTGDAARLLNVTPKTVHQLESKGSLTAERTTSGTRLFDEDDVKRLVRERAARKAKNGR